MVGAPRVCYAAEGALVTGQAGELSGVCLHGAAVGAAVGAAAAAAAAAAAFGAGAGAFLVGVFAVHDGSPAGSGGVPVAAAGGGSDKAGWEKGGG